METAKVMLTNLQSFSLGHTKGLLGVLLRILASVYKTAVSTVYFSQGELVAPSDRENRPASSLLVPIPFQLRVDSTKEQIPVLKWSEILRRFGSHNNQDVVKRCAVCLTCMKEQDEVREIRSCFHVFHKECLDAWIDKGKVTCPLCRINMLSEEKFNSCGVDPWRRERMLYLFGEDITF